MTENVTLRAEKKRASDSPKAQQKEISEELSAPVACTVELQDPAHPSSLSSLVSVAEGQKGGQDPKDKCSHRALGQLSVSSSKQKEGALRAGFSQPLTLLRASTQDLWKKSLEVTSDPLQHQARTQMALQLDVQPAGLPGSLL